MFEAVSDVVKLEAARTRRKDEQADGGEKADSGVTGLEQNHNNAPIGIFGSGVGGLTVARTIVDLLPHESIIYIEDTANSPYGDKTIAQVAGTPAWSPMIWLPQGEDDRHRL